MSKKLESLEWIDGMDAVFRRLASLHPKKIDLSLGRMHRILEALSNPHLELPPTIHIAGTNGKGSQLAFLKSLIKGDSKISHCYTSPHLMRFNERIVIAGEMITAKQASTLALRVEEANSKQQLTFFEALTAIAFLAFREAEANFCLLETGLGGRLDATNVIDKVAAAIITPIDYDHQAFLGESLAEIAFEKAGIIKANCPVILAKQHKEVLSVIKTQAEKRQSPLFCAGIDWQVRKTENGWHYEDSYNSYDLPLPRLQGAHQIDSAGCALFATNFLSLNLTQDKIAASLINTKWRARLEKIEICGRQVILDGAHNPAAAETIKQFLIEEKSKNPSAPCFLICALRANKSAEGFIAKFTNLLTTLYAVPLPNAETVPGESAKSYHPDEICELAQKLNINSKLAKNVEDAIDNIQLKPEPIIIIAGSLLLAGDVLKRFS